MVLGNQLGGCGVDGVVSGAGVAHRAEREAVDALLGVSAATVRLSVGVEDVDDLLADLEQALGKA